MAYMCLLVLFFLTIYILRYVKFHFSPQHHFGFENATWYWHFVDVVWLVLYLSSPDEENRLFLV